MNRLVEPLETRRLMDAGELDTTFADGAGFIEIPGESGSRKEIVDLDVDPQGDILAIVRTTPLDDIDHPVDILHRFHADGSPATWFGDGGRLPLPVGVGGVHIAGDGGILLQLPSSLRKYRSNGKLAREFGDDGTIRFDRLPNYSLDQDAAGNIYVVGQTYAPNTNDDDLQTMKFAPDGTPNPDYAQTAQSTLGTTFPDLQGFSMNVLPDGRLMLATRRVEDPATVYYIATRLNEFGNIDSAYGDGGTVIAREQGGHQEFGPFKTAHERGFTEDGYALFEIRTEELTSDRLSTELVSRVLGAFDPQGEQAFNTDLPLNANSFGLGFLHHEGYLIGTGRMGPPPSFFDLAGDLQPAPSAAIAQATQTGGGEQTFGRLAPANDGSLLLAAQSGQAGTGATFSNDVRLYRLFAGDAPAAQLHAVRNLKREREASYRFTIQYRDDDGVNVASLGDDDITVALPGGGGRRRKARLLDTELSDGGRVVTATYRVTAPDGVWDAGDNGIYAVRLERRSVRDSNGVAAAQRQIGVFHVAIAPSGTPIASTARPASQSLAAAAATRNFEFDALNRRETDETDETAGK